MPTERRSPRISASCWFDVAYLLARVEGRYVVTDELALAAQDLENETRDIQ